MADRIFRAGEEMLRRDMCVGPFRLIGIGLSGLVPATAADLETDLLDPSGGRRLAAERAADRIRARYGDTSIVFGRAIR
jgi:DNA polymerase-4